MICTGIDPGPESSAWATWDGEMIISMGMMENQKMIGLMSIGMFQPNTFLVVEGIQSFGRIVGRSTFDTCTMIGMLLHAAGIPWDKREEHIIYRPFIKSRLLGTVRGGDKEVRNALIKILGKEKTAGVSGHCWSALAVAYVYYSVVAEAKNLEKRKLS